MREDDQQLMEYYLPEEEHLERLSEAYEQPISSEQLEELRTLMEEDADDPRIDDMFKVSRKKYAALTSVRSLRPYPDIRGRVTRPAQERSSVDH